MQDASRKRLILREFLCWPSPSVSVGGIAAPEWPRESNPNRKKKMGHKRQCFQQLRTHGTSDPAHGAPKNLVFFATGGVTLTGRIPEG